MLETTDEFSKPPRNGLQFGILNRHERSAEPHANGIREKATDRSGSTPGTLQRLSHFLHAQARASHAHQRDERQQHFVRAFADLVDAMVAEHAFEWSIGEVGGAAEYLECVVDDRPQPFGAPDFEHRRFEHVVFEAAIDEAGGNGRHGFHGVRPGGHAGEFLLHEFKLGQRTAELAPCAGVIGGES